MGTLNGLDLDSLVRLEEGRVSHQIYHDEAIYQLELERIFARCWIVVGHDSLIPNAGDFFTSYIGEDPVIVIRQQDGSVRVLLNQCRHKGTRVCRADEGNARAFTCPYHAWTYDGSGRLVGVPNIEEYHGGLRTEQFGLRSVAKVENYKGLIFATWDHEAPPLEDYLADAGFILDTILDRLPGGMEIVGGIQKWTVKCNWKWAAENFVGDMYHVVGTHMSLPRLLMPEGVDVSEVMATNIGGENTRLVTWGNGHGGAYFQEDSLADALKALFGPNTPHYEREILPALEERLAPGQVELSKYGSSLTIFPNFSPTSGLLFSHLWHPKGPNETEFWCWAFIDKSAPPEIKEERRRGVLRTFSPAGMLEADDSEIWSEIQSVGRGFVARKEWVNVQMGLFENGLVDDPNFPCQIEKGMSDRGAWEFYGRWLDLLKAESWSDLKGSPTRRAHLGTGVPG